LNKILLKIDNFNKKFKILETIKSFFYDCFKMPMHLIIYPIQGYEDFKTEKLSKSYVAWFYLFMIILVQTIAFNGNGFLVNNNNPKDFNLFLTIALIVFPVAIIVVANWATTALMDGKGNMQEIFRVLTYSFFPYVWFSLLATLISNYITLDEVMFFNFFKSIGVFLTVYMLFFGLMGIHEYGLMKTILMIVFTIVAIAVILFIILLFLSLFQQFWTYIKSVYDEFVMRYL